MNRVIPDKYFALDGPTPAKIRVTIICSARSQSLTTTKSNFGLFCPKVYLFTSLKVIYELAYKQIVFLTFLRNDATHVSYFLFQCSNFRSCFRQIKKAYIISKVFALKENKTHIFGHCFSWLYCIIDRFCFFFFSNDCTRELGVEAERSRALIMF